MSVTHGKVWHFDLSSPATDDMNSPFDCKLPSFMPDLIRLLIGRFGVRVPGGVSKQTVALQQVLELKGRSLGRPFCRRYPRKGPKLRGPSAIVADVASYQAMTDTFERLKAALADRYTIEHES